jgi:HD-GYP domain-containing protein (c-di-GMP phosphodiesterase class II)
MIIRKYEKWIPVKKSNLKYYDDIDLFYLNKSTGDVLLYKSSGMKISDIRLQRKGYSGDLYIRQEDKAQCLRAVQKGFSFDLVQLIESEDVERIKSDLICLVDEALNEPRAGGLEVVPEVIEAVVDSYSRQPAIIKNLARISYTDYSTTIHSINVMALTLGYCFYKKLSFGQTVRYGLAALFHDIGKTEIPQSILKASRTLTPSEYSTMKKHTILGAEILQVNDPSVHSAIPGAMEHHEKLDGSGYPHNKEDISEIGQILGVIDSYEAMTNNERFYRSGMDPLEALSQLKDEVDNKRLSKGIFEDFAYSLTDFSKNNSKNQYKDIFRGWNRKNT